MSRQFLITKLVCSKCGGNLNLTYDKPKQAGQYANGEPTGADMLQNCIAVEPCRQCAEPLLKMREALKVLGIGGEHE